MTCYHGTPQTSQFLLAAFGALMLVLITACSTSTEPQPVDILPKSGVDQPPHFDINYHRSETTNSNGLIESIQLSLSHSVNGNLIDYGNVAFGGVELRVETRVGSTDYYYEYLQSNLPDRLFADRFRFEGDNLFFRVTESPAIENVSVELQVEPVSYLINPSQGALVDPNQNLTLTFNRDIRQFFLALYPGDPFPTTEPMEINFLQPMPARTVVLESQQLLALQSQSQGNVYYMIFFASSVANSIQVKAKNSDQTVILPVYASSWHVVDFVMH